MSSSQIFILLDITRKEMSMGTRRTAMPCAIARQPQWRLAEDYHIAAAP